MDKILHHEDTQGMALASWLYTAVKRGGPGLKPTTDTHTTQRVEAYVNYGQWVAECPSGDGGAIQASRTEPFMCPECWNEPWGGQWLEVVYPANKTAVEAVLLARPKVRNDYRTRNWVPSETVAVLQAENAERGLALEV